MEKGSVSEIMRLAMATIVEKAAVTDEGIVDLPSGKRKPKSRTVTKHCDDLSYLDKVFKGLLNGKIQDSYSKRKRYESLIDSKYIDTGAIFDIMAHIVIQHGLELAQAA